MHVGEPMPEKVFCPCLACVWLRPRPCLRRSRGQAVEDQGSTVLEHYRKSSSKESQGWSVATHSPIFARNHDHA